MPSARVRLAGEAAFLVLVALGLGLAGFSPIVIVGVMLIAVVLVALLERASAKEAARPQRKRAEPLAMPPPQVERVEAEQEPLQDSQPEPEPDPEPTVSERSARTLLASALPPRPPAPPKPRRSRPAAAPSAPSPPPPEPEPQPAPAVPPRAWNLWELQRTVRDATDDDRHEEWTVLLIHLREFANADGDLPLEFDGLVRESFGPLLARSAEPAAAP